MILELLSALTKTFGERMKTDEEVELSYQDFSAIRMQLFSEAEDLEGAAVNNQKLNILTVTINGTNFNFKPKDK